MRIEIDDQGVYRDHNGQAHVRCKADPSSPFFINVSSSLIETIWKGDRCRIDLALVKLPCDIMEAAKSYLIKKLEVTSPLMLYPFFRSLKLLEQAWQTQWADFSDISLGELFKILLNGNRHYAAELRRFYSYCASEHLADADEVLALEMKSLTIHNRNSYAAVLKWDETRGALTSAEQELVRREMTVGDISEPIADITARLFTWISFETLKRPLQVATTTADAVWIPDNNSDNTQYFLKIPKAKFQTGEKPELWPITEKLAHQIFLYSRIPLVREKQLQTNTLLVSLKDGLKPTFGRMVTNWCTRRGIISPRTKKPLVLTPYRIRHTGATQMAAQGASSDEIQYILEHDSTDAVRAYIDCLASEFRPLIERANRKLGHIFSELNNLYFSGSIGDAATGSPVLIPALNMPALVGGCTKNGSCGQHPFFSCYNGCRYFIAWRDADHQKSLVYLEKEMLRWGAAEGGKDRSKFLRDLEQTYQAVKDVLRCIDNGE